MKKMRFMAALAALVTMVGFTSCLDDNNGSSYDFRDYVTVTTGMAGETRLVCDVSGLILHPVNASVLAPLQLTDGSYYERALVGVKLTEEYSASKTTYDVSEISLIQAVPYKKFTEAVGSLTVDSKLSALDKTIWAKAKFVNVVFDVKVNSSETSKFYDDMHMYITKASNDTLYTRLQYNKANESGQTYSAIMMSFKLPENSVMYSNLIPKNDSIVIKVVANGEFGPQLEATTKYRYDELRY